MYFVNRSYVGPSIPLPSKPSGEGSFSSSYEWVRWDRWGCLPYVFLIVGLDLGLGSRETGSVVWWRRLQLRPRASVRVSEGVCRVAEGRGK